MDTSGRNGEGKGGDSLLSFPRRRSASLLDAHRAPAPPEPAPASPAPRERPQPRVRTEDDVRTRPATADAPAAAPEPASRGEGLLSRLAARFRRQPGQEPSVAAAPAPATVRPPRETPHHEDLREARRPDSTRDPRHRETVREVVEIEEHRPVEPLAIRHADEGGWRPLVDPLIVFGQIRRSAWLILGTTIAGALIAAAIAVSTPRTYSAHAELLVDPREWRITDRDFNQSWMQSEAVIALIENQVRVLTSRPVMAATVERLGLAEDPEFNGEGGGGFSPFAVVGAVRGLLSPAGPAEERDRRAAVAAEQLARQVWVERSGRTFIVMVGVETTGAEKSARIANTLVDVFLETYGQIQATTSGRAADELSARLDELRSGVEQAERAVAAFKAENEIVDAQGRLITDEEILRLNDQLSQARARTAELNARAASARDLDVQAVLDGTLPEQVSSATMAELRAQHTSARIAADRLAIRLGPRHPERMAAEAQVEAAARQIQIELRRIVASLQVDLRRAVQLEQELASELARLKVRHGGLDNELVTLRELEREAAAKRAVYEAYLLRARETGEQRELNAANIGVISEAVAPLRASGMSRGTMTMLGALAGFMLGIGLAGARGAYVSFTARPARSPEPDPTPRGRRPAEPESHDWRRRTSTERTTAEEGWREAPAATASTNEEEAEEMYRDHRYGPDPRPAPAQHAQPQPYQHGPYAPPPAWPPYADPYQAYAYAYPPQPNGMPHAQPHIQPQQTGWPQPHPASWPQPADPNAARHPQESRPPYRPEPVAGWRDAPEPRRAARDEDIAQSIEEIRDSLREFREAIEYLTEQNHQRRRYGT